MTDKNAAGQASREKLLAAARELMLDSGYAAVTSRKVAQRAGLKPQLVHYHFRSMDDLFLALYRDFARQLMDRLDAVPEARNPLRAMWQVAEEARGALLTEFVALANHRKVIQAEITDYGHRFRHKQIAIMERLLADNSRVNFPWSPAFAALLLNSLARGLVVEEAFDITEGHSDARELVESMIASFEPSDSGR